MYDTYILRELHSRLMKIDMKMTTIADDNKYDEIKPEIGELTKELNNLWDNIIKAGD